ncbi:MAG TPA: phosphohistidine phosphatase [Chitinophagaceae bacterium]|jgi:phosphohistidine phosphatase|nr:phosphohistidine phosphatase [Chitinophagaceae bacterium]
MKTLILVRHAKSSHSLGLSPDFDRPLNERGFREAAEIGRKLYKKKIPIDQFVSSPALRAKTTAELFSNEYNRKMKDILLIPSLYQADPDQFSKVVSGLDDAYQHVALFAHNPGITEFASSLTDTQVTNMPTSSVFAVNASVDSWKDFAGAEKSFLFFYKPE